MVRAPSRSVFALFALLGVLALVVVFASPVRSQVGESVDFEGHPANPPGTGGIDIEPEFYAERGIWIEAGTVLEYEEGFASSGRNGLEMCYAAEFCTAPFIFTFATPQHSVAARVGYGRSLAQAAPLLMVAYDSDGGRIAIGEVEIGPGSPVPVDALLVVEDPETRIASVEVRWVDAERFMDGVVVDDVEFIPFAPVLALAADPNPLVVESEEPFATEIVVTNTGNIEIPFLVGVDDPSGAFQLVDTICGETLPPGDDCVLQVLFDPAEPGSYDAQAVLFDVDESPMLIIGLEGVQPSVDIPVEPEAADEPEVTSPPADESSTETQAAQPTEVPPLDGSEDPPTWPVWILLAAIGTGALLLWRRRRVRRARADPKRGAPPGHAPTVLVRSSLGLHEIDPNKRQPVSAIHVAVDAERTTTTLTEEAPR